MDPSIAPFVPAWFDVLGAVVTVAWLVLVVVALVSIARSASLTASQRVLWTVAVLLLPVLASVAWLATVALERRLPRRRAAAGAGEHA